MNLARWTLPLLIASSRADPPAAKPWLWYGLFTSNWGMFASLSLIRNDPCVVMGISPGQSWCCYINLKIYKKIHFEAVYFLFGYGVSIQSITGNISSSHTTQKGNINIFKGDVTTLDFENLLWIHRNCNQISPLSQCFVHDKWEDWSVNEYSCLFRMMNKNHSWTVSCWFRYHADNWVFPKCFHLIQWIQWQKSLVITVKGLEPVTQPPHV